MSEIILVTISASQLGLEFEKLHNRNLDLKTSKSIFNAWQVSTLIDSTGTIWVSTSKLHTILRTKKEVARYTVDTINDEHKIKKEGQVYIRGSQISYLIDTTIQSAGSIKREDYARNSEDNYREIRDSSEVRLIRARHNENIHDLKSVLKQTRKKQLGITKDELTGIEIRTAFSNKHKLLNKSVVMNQRPFREFQFAHIRSIATYPDLTDKIWNGLIVHENTHKIITKNNINDGDQLLSLCQDRQWNTDWYSSYSENLYNYKQNRQLN